MSQTGKFLNLHPHMTSWAVYNVNGPYTSANKIGSLSPAQFGGISYNIIEDKGSDIYIIQTDSFGKCAIWAPIDNDSSITYERAFSNGGPGGSGGGTLLPGGNTGNGKYLNLHSHIPSWGVYNVNGPYTTANKIGSLAPAQFSGLSYSILEEKGGDVYIIQTDSFGRCAIWAPRDNDSSITTSPSYSNGNTSGGGIISGNGKYLNLHAHMQNWGVYNVNGPYTSANKIGSLAPAQFSGLSYSILEEKGGDVYIIQTDSFGRCAIWAPRDNDSSITTSPSYSNGNTSGGGSTGGSTGNGKYLNLHAHMPSWGVYNVNGPYTSANKIGSLAPAQFSGLSYSILEEKGGDVYIIQTDSFGRCAIWAPRDNDSSITTSPSYSNGNTSGGSTTPGGGGGVIIPGGLKVFIDPGHGGSDPGAIGNGLNEKDVVLSISEKLGVLLNARGVSVQYSRTSDIAVSLEGRPQQANTWGANLFVSIHANAFDSSSRGTECYTTPSADSKTKQLSANVSKSISNKFGIPNRGHKEEIWRVLRLSNMPAILIETAFIDNSSDANLLRARQDDFATAISNEICAYLNITNTPIDPIKPIDPIAIINNTGFAKDFGVKFTQTNEEKIIAKTGPICIKLTNTTSKSYGSGKIIANFANGTFSNATYKNAFNSISLSMKDKVSLSTQLLKLGARSFSIAVSDEPKSITISLTTTTKINDSISINQILSFEFDKANIISSAVKVGELVDELLEKTPAILIPLLLFVIVIVFIYLSLDAIIALGASAFSGLGLLLFNMFIKLLSK